jgi:hypothetical protein
MSAGEEVEARTQLMQRLVCLYAAGNQNGVTAVQWCIGPIPPERIVSVCMCMVGELITYIGRQAGLPATVWYMLRAWSMTHARRRPVSEAPCDSGRTPPSINRLVSQPPL